jgi:hypothetical protein
LRSERRAVSKVTREPGPEPYDRVLEPKGVAMYARMTRFEGGNPATLTQELDDMRRQMESGLTDEAIDQMAEQVKGQFDRDEVARLLRSIKRTIVLADTEKGSSAMVLFCDTEEDARGVDRLFDAMSPGEGGGKRQSADVYEVAVDQTFSS